MDKQTLSVPVAIIIAGVLVAGAVLYTSSKKGDGSLPGLPAEKEASVRPVSKDDHILGNPNAPVVIVEYSDFECPFCKTFHATMQEIMRTYGKDGKVAWVYRHFPLEQLHARATNEALASECVAELGGNEKFWTYIDRIFAVTPSNDQLDPALLPKLAKDIGIDSAAFDSCMTSGRYLSDIEKSVEEAIRSGAQGTPHNFIVTKDSSTAVEGAQPLAAMKSLIDAILADTKSPGVRSVPVVQP